jgi:hypothetical protein
MVLLMEGKRIAISLMRKIMKMMMYHMTRVRVMKTMAISLHLRKTNEKLRMIKVTSK